MQRIGLRVGEPSNTRLGLIMLAAWGVVGIMAIITAATSLSGP
jgi:hypothetical protein